MKASSLRAAYGDVILMITEQKLLHWRLQQLKDYLGAISYQRVTSEVT